MSINVANKFVVTPHRPAVVKEAMPNAKDAFRNQQDPPLLPQRHAKGSKRPLIEFAKVTPYTRFPTVVAVHEALEALRATEAVGTLAEAVHKARNHVAAHVAANPSRPLLVIIGDNHLSDLAMAMVMPTLNELRGSPKKKYLVEQPPAAVPDAMRLELAGQLRIEFEGAVQGGAPFEANSGNAKHDRWIANAAFGAALGYSTHGFDPGHSAAGSQEERETSMQASISQALTDGSEVVVVSAGEHHLPRLHEAFAGKVNLLAMTVMGTSPDLADTEDIKRKSYLLATPAILKLCPTPDLFTAAIGAADPVRELDGLTIQAPSPQPLTARASRRPAIGSTVAVHTPVGDSS